MLFLARKKARRGYRFYYLNKDGVDALAQRMPVRLRKLLVISVPH